MKRARAAALAVASAALASAALAGSMDPRKPLDFVVGLPKGVWPTARMDAHRRAEADVALPRTLRKDWSRPVASYGIEAPPLVDDKGNLIVVSTRGELTWLDAAGAEVARVALGTGPVGPATLLGDGTVVVVSTAGEAVGATKGGVRFRTRLGGDRGGVAAPLPLEDGGAVVATASELTALDASGTVRARAALSDTLAGGALVAAGGRVIAVAASGSVRAWSPGRDATRVGSFGGPIDGGAAALDEHTLVAVVEGRRIVALDLDRGVTVPRTPPAAGLYLGPVAVRGSTVYAMLLTQQQAFVVAFDAAGREVLRAAVPGAALVAPDAGALLVAPPHTGVIVDRAGAVAFATPDGNVGVVDPAGIVSLAADLPCVRYRASTHAAAVVGLAPQGPGTLALACDSGTVARFSSGG